MAWEQRSALARDRLGLPNFRTRAILAFRGRRRKNCRSTAGLRQRFLGTAWIALSKLK